MANSTPSNADPTLAPRAAVPTPAPRDPTPAPPILMYTIAEYPGNSADSWGRQFWGQLAHGAKMFDLFGLVTGTSAPLPSPPPSIPSPSLAFPYLYLTFLTSPDRHRHLRPHI